MRAGLLRHKVTLQRPNDLSQVDSTGDPVPAPLELGQVRAEKKPLRGREFFEADQTMAETTCRWSIRYFPGLRAKDQLIDGEDVWDIQAVIDLDGRGREMEIVAVLHA